MIISLCHKCKTSDYKTVVKYLRKRYPEAKFDVGCQGYCGPGSFMQFVAIDEYFISADTTEELLKLVVEYIEDEQ